MSVFGMTLILAHQSDWMSLVLVLIPLGLFAWVLAIANRRAGRDGPVHLGPEISPSGEPTDTPPD